MEERKYYNFLHNKTGCEGANYPEFMTRRELISMTVDSIKGTSEGMVQGFNDYLDFMKTNGCGVDFYFDYLTIEELETLVDQEIFYCEDCGWIYDFGELYIGEAEHYGNICQQCGSNLEEEEDEK